ncbi:Crp/Fnr family transcriptional regulator [Lederbergia sp. NSJ-179]|uniref:Crp/Fnr family transcriptional regulator n=1 Tax=Lederbergia sp. NSJ-179 TaxID=2931402 RepID=UPI001FD466E3|nr:Crp/Fnr family transcriptional regulator [Lederbergia sp. NSJ-179]MCJ7842726.1 Crp/Fnr family transcriptional regulator [Lederbergia sp. NSJ-179]
MLNSVQLCSPSLMSMLESIVQHEKAMGKGEYVFQEGDRADFLFIVRSGKVQIGKVTSEGREITFRICKPGDFICEVSLFDEPSSFTVYAKVLEAGVFCIIPKKALEEKLVLQPDLSIEMIKMMNIQHQQSQSKFRDLVLHGKKGALYSTLIRLTNSYGVEHEDGVLINLPLTNQELANFCGMTREVVNRLLRELKKEGKLTMINGRIVIHDLAYLKREIHCENCPIEICNIY